LVKSVKGAQGGYLLAKDPSEITAGMILSTLEGDLSVIDESKEAESQKDSIQYYLKDHLWQKINLSIEDVVKAVTLEELAQGYKASVGESALMYYI
jgi:Rrf2 family protein